MKPIRRIQFYLFLVALFLSCSAAFAQAKSNIAARRAVMSIIFGVREPALIDINQSSNACLNMSVYCWRENTSASNQMAIGLDEFTRDPMDDQTLELRHCSPSEGLSLGFGKRALYLGYEDRAISWYRYASGCKEYWAVAAMELGDIYLLRTEWNKAVREFRKSLTSSDRDIPRGSIHYKIGNILFRKSNPPDLIGALRSFQTALTLGQFETRSERSLAYFGKVEVLKALGRYDEALAAAYNAYQDNQGVYESVYHLGQLYRINGQFLPAVKYLREAVDINPVKRDALWELALSYQALGNSDQVIHILHKLLLLDPNDIEALMLKNEIGTN